LPLSFSCRFNLYLQLMTVQLLLFAGFVASMIFMSFNLQRRRKKVLFLGDSLTAAASAKAGYIAVIKDLIRSNDEEQKYDLINAGVNGNKVTDLLERLDEDVLKRGPEIVVVFIGINDVWHKLNGNGTSIEVFEQQYKILLTTLVEASIKVMVCTPPLIGEKPGNINQFNDDLDAYSSVIRRLASEMDVPVVDLRAAFVSVISINNLSGQEAGILTTDGVHLNAKGNELAGYEIWRVLKELR
jgi:lysophospholipase L1-like esterase